MSTQASATGGPDDYFEGLDTPTYGKGIRRLLGYNTSNTYSPIILNREWPTLCRMILIVSFTSIGTIVNGFYVASFFIDNRLKQLGNVYLACLGLADMVISTAVIPISAVVLISGIWDIMEICNVVHLLTEGATYSYNLLFMMVSIENYFRLCCSRVCYKRFLRIPVGLISFLIFGICFACSAIGTYMAMDYDYCCRKHFGNHTYRLVTGIVFEALPCLITVTLLFTSSFSLRARARRMLHYKRSKQYDRDYGFINLHIACYLIFIGAWTPYLIVVNKYPTTSDSHYYNLAWLGVARSLITSFLYSGLNRNFRRAFCHLFYYCCCKSTMATPSTHNRHRKGFEYKLTTGDVRVHILHHSVATCPQRATTGQRERGALDL